MRAGPGVGWEAHLSWHTVKDTVKSADDEGWVSVEAFVYFGKQFSRIQ